MAPQRRPSRAGDTLQPAALQPYDELTGRESHECEIRRMQASGKGKEEEHAHKKESGEVSAFVMSGGSGGGEVSRSGNEAIAARVGIGIIPWGRGQHLHAVIIVIILQLRLLLLELLLLLLVLAMLLLVALVMLLLKVLLLLVVMLLLLVLLLVVGLPGAERPEQAGRDAGPEEGLTALCAGAPQGRREAPGGRDGGGRLRVGPRRKRPGRGYVAAAPRPG
jgi:hypothetical protein